MVKGNRFASGHRLPDQEKKRLKEKGKTLTGLEKNLFAFYYAQDALTDYVSFRTLLREKLYLSSLQLAVTSVEKLLKATANFLSKTDIFFQGHDSLEFYKRNKELFDAFGIELNEELLSWLSKIYETRYTNSLGEMSSFGFSYKHLLFEVDEIFFHFFTWFKEINEEVGSLYFKHKEIGRIRENNCRLQEIEPDNYLLGPHRLIDVVYLGNYPTWVESHLFAFKGLPFSIDHYSFDRQTEILTKNFNVGTIDLLDLPPEYYLSLSGSYLRGSINV